MRILLICLVLFSACSSEESCIPTCQEGQECGLDGCRGYCGECGEGAVCMEGLCEACEPDCLGRTCGPDGCNGHCGFCSDGQVCSPQSYLCIDLVEDCEGQCNGGAWECGPDGCGGDCGVCDWGEAVCNPDLHICTGLCLPACADKECGDDGCGGTCGECDAGQECLSDTCIGGNKLPEEDFMVAFGYRGRIPGYNDSEMDLHLINSDGSNPLSGGDGPHSLTSFSLESTTDCQLILQEDENGEPLELAPCSCRFGCFLDDALDWIAISLKQPDADGFTFQLGRFNQDMQVQMVKGTVLENLVDFKFAGNYLFFSRRMPCQTASCQYTIYRVQLDPVQAPEPIIVFPPDDDPDWIDGQSVYKGHFLASDDGSVLTLQGTTIRSNRIYVWDSGSLHELDYICSNVLSGECIGAGSEYSDTDPIAISPDGKTVAAFTIAQRDLRLRLYDLETNEQRYLDLFSVPAGGYLVNICPNIMDESWKFKKVVGNPVFTSDGKSLIFQVLNDCNTEGGQVKLETDILLMDLAVVGDGTPFEETDFINITRNPKGNFADNQVVGSFSVSPEGKVIAMTATPAFGQGTSLPDDSNRSMKDREIWLIGINGAGKTQLTDEGAYEAVSPQVFSPTVLPEHFQAQ